ncbi:MATE family efflux transporter [Kiloniella sp. b19]|uniref:MATE family efflux transporter n=1 Tax=Kiloniella sp. GXU_MW_B19 TaxID=3141326 RepID=UPI0031D4000E
MTIEQTAVVHNDRQPHHEPQKPRVPDLSWTEEMRETLVLAWPMVAAQLAMMALGVTDVIMMGWLGPEKLAAGAIATSLGFTFFLGFGGVLNAVSPIIAQARGRRDIKSVRRCARQGFWASLILFSGLTVILLNGERLLLLFGQEPLVAARGGIYMLYAVWGFFPAMLAMVLRFFLAAHADTRLFLWVTIAGVGVNFVGNYALMFGNFGFPRLELMGAGISTSVVNAFMFLCLLAYVLWHRHYKRYYLLVRLWKADFERLREIFRVGTPIGAMIFAESSLFGGVSIMMGWLGTDTLAAHSVALQCIAVAFMVPLGLSQAATVRVGLAAGQQSRENVRKAGWVSIGFGVGFMCITAGLFAVIPEVFISAFLDGNLEINREPIRLAITFLQVAAVFQLVDGLQVVAGGVLRGLKDTSFPMWAGIIGYWGVGAPFGYLMAFVFDLDGRGIWMGMAAGLAVVAVILLIRFIRREQVGLLKECY